MRHMWIGGVIALVLASGAGAQQTLSDVESLRHQLLVAQSALTDALERAAPCDAQARRRAITEEAMKLKADVERAHPGMQFDVQAGVLTPAGSPQQP
jgi:hypothetical protein